MNKTKISLFCTLFFLSTSIFSAHAQSSVAVNPDSLRNLPAPAFSLKDLEGKEVSLSDFKGKILILDFWATWCVPCIKTFPAMQIAIDKYKDDPTVQFLFIDTKEKVENYPALIKQLITDNHYSFHVLLDEKTAEGSMNKAFRHFGTPYIPAKFIVDKQGIVRFVGIGYQPDLSDQDIAKGLIGEIENIRKMY